MPRTEGLSFGSRRHLPWRRAFVGLGLVAFLLGLAAGGSLAAARAELQAARAAAAEGRQRLLAADPVLARAAFDRSGRALVRARTHLTNPAVLLIGTLPGLGDTLGTVDTMAGAGALVARAGTELAAGLGRLPGGMAALVPADGAIPLSSWQALQEPLSRAAASVGQARTMLEADRQGAAVPPVARARQELLIELDRAGPQLQAAAALADELPAFLGAHGPRHYFIGAANPAELRGTGGLIGAYAILTADGGRLTVSDFSPVQDLPTLTPREVPPPNSSYAARFDRYGGAGFWLNINMTPDFATAATAIERLYERVAGERLDGTVVADPAALAALLKVTGPAEVPGGATVDAAEVVRFVTNEAYAELADPQARKQLLGEVAAGVLRRFLEGTDGVDPVLVARALGEAANGHLLFHAAESRVQAAFEAANLTGRLLDPPGDFLAVIGNNAAGHKADYYAGRAVRYEATLARDGSARGEATVSLSNGAPTEGLPPYVIGPNAAGLAAGDNATILSVYASGDAALDRFARDGKAALVGSERDLGHRVYTSRARLAAGTSTELGYVWTVADGWQGYDGGGRYRLTFQGQTTIRPTRLQVLVDVPEGMQVVRASPGMRVEAGRAVWEGTAPRLATFEVTFARPAVDRGWRAFRRFLDRSILDLSDNSV